MTLVMNPGTVATKPAPGEILSPSQVSNVMDLNSLFDTQIFEACTYRRMFEFAVVVYVFNSGIRNAAVIFKKRR